MRLIEIFENKNPYRDTDLPLSNYRGPYNPRSDNLDTYGKEHDDASRLWDMIDDFLEDGVGPKITEVPIDTLLATQDWLSSEPGDGPMWDEFEDKPVVLDHNGKRYILDGHNRISREKRSGKKTILVYYFSKNGQQLDEINFKKAAAGGAIALAALNPSIPNFSMPHPPKPKVQQEDPKIQKVANKIADRYKIKPGLALKIVQLAKKYEKPDFPKADDILSVIGIESSFNPDAVSGLKRDPAVGLTQIRPGVWQLKSSELKGDMEQQISKSADILAHYNKKLKNPKDALHAYNVGLTNFKSGDPAKLNPKYVDKFNKERKHYDEPDSNTK